MQHASVYLYSNKIDVYINPVNLALTETYHSMYTRNLKIYRSVDNTIEIRVKNADQRAASINDDVYLVFNLTTCDTQKYVLKQECDIRDRLLGIASVTLTQDQMLNLEKGYYRYTIVQEKRQPIESGSDEYIVVKSLPTYVGTAFDAIGEVEVAGDTVGNTVSSIVVNEFSYVNPIGLGETEPVAYTSSIIDSDPSRSTPQTMHTFQFYFDEEFTGDVAIQASLEDQGATPMPSSWVDVETFTIYPEDHLPTDLPGTPEDPIDVPPNKEYVTLIGKYNWFRVKYYPITDTDGFAIGKINKVLYR